MMNETQPELSTRAERRAERRNGAPWAGAVILIALGLVFLFQNLGIATLHNWWALFILIPAFGSLANAWRLYQVNGELGPATGPFIGGLVFTVVALIFLFDINLGPSWNVFWPVVLIVFGIALLLQALGRRSA